MPNLTNHSIRRMHERIGVTRGVAKKHAKKVLENGIQHKDTMGELNLWMNREFLRYGTTNNMRYYAGSLYIFSDILLITVMKASPEIERNLSEYVRDDVYKEYKKHRSQKEKKSKEQIKKIEQQEIAENILDAVSNYTELNKKDIIICNVHFISEHVVRVTYVSDEKVKDWHKYTDIIMYIKEHFYVGVYLTKVKNKEGKYVTIEEWKKLKKI